MTVDELRDSVAFTAGVAHERRRMAAQLRHRAFLLMQLPGSTARTVVAELCRLADSLEEAA